MFTKLPLAKLVRWLLPVLAVLAFGAWVWPTPYRYHRVSVSGRSTLVRENRVTGSLAMLRIGSTGGEWRSVAASAPSSDPLASYRSDWRTTAPVQMDTGMRMDTVP